MFRKYPVLIAAMLMLSATTFSTAENAQYTADSTFAPFCCTNDSGITTCSDVCATFMATTATCHALCATECDFITTSSPVLTENHLSVPTAVPLSVTVLPGSAGNASLQMLSTVEDYTTPSAYAQEQMMMNLLNQDRKNNGLAPLTYDPELSRIARIKSEDMRNNRYFAHESPTYGNIRQMLRSFGYAFSGAGENIAHHASVEKAQAAFMSSRGHRANILSAAWTKIGIGICFDANGFIYATQVFAR